MSGLALESAGNGGAFAPPASSADDRRIAEAVFDALWAGGITWWILF